MPVPTLLLLPSPLVGPETWRPVATWLREQGRDATIPMIARKGRASYLGERSAGHQDPGATSVTLLLTAAATTLNGGD